MAGNQPNTELDPQFSSSDATPIAWAEASERLGQAEIYWLSTMRPDGRPHVTPLIAVWLDDALYFCTGQAERKAKNIARNSYCAVTTGCNALNAEGLDLVVEGQAVQVRDMAKLRRIADAYELKYGSDWRFTVRDQGFLGAEGNIALVFEVAPTTAFGFGKGKTFSQTRWRF
jgi:hypothetical protein